MKVSHNQIRGILVEILHNPKYLNCAPQHLQSHIKYIIKDMQYSPENVLTAIVDVLATGLQEELLTLDKF